MIISTTPPDYEPDSISLYYLLEEFTFEHETHGPMLARQWGYGLLGSAITRYTLLKKLDSETTKRAPFSISRAELRNRV